MVAPSDRVLGTAIGVSLVLHAAALAVHFKFPEAMRWKSESKALEVVLRFYAHESCGQCPPCREGTYWLYEIVHRIREGKQTITVTVPRLPARAGIDPARKLMDTNKDDNVVAVERR